MKKLLALMVLSVSFSSSAVSLPDFLDPNEINNAEFVCLPTKQDYSPQEQQYIDQLWQETLTYLEGYARALRSLECTLGITDKCSWFAYTIKSVSINSPIAKDV